MKYLLVGCIFVAILGLGSNLLAFQEAIGVVTNSNIDSRTQLCTITIDRRHPSTTQTNQCNQKKFSWKCLPGDYRYALAEYSQRDRQAIQIRYSENSCDGNTGNMMLLTVW
jgi:hypothetical protein